MSNSDFTDTSHPRFVDHTGMRYGFLTVVKLAAPQTSPSGSRVTRWLCKCVCGVEKVIAIRSLQAQLTLSCGCHNSRTTANRNFKHGKADSPEFTAWTNMWTRCTKETNSHYQSYKDRAPPPEWKDFSVFYAELGPKPTPKHSLDRIDNEKPYGPGNCRWATAETQAGNTRKNIYVELGGERLWLAEACRRLGDRLPKYGTITNRISKGGQTVEEASDYQLKAA